MEQVEKYFTFTLLSESFMSITYKGEDRETGKKVIIKKFKEREKYLRERDILRILGESKYIVSVVREFDDESVLVYEYLEKSVDLFGLIERRAQNLAGEENPSSAPLLTDIDMVNIAIRLTEGLRYIHLKKVVHHDIKPENIIVKGTFPFYIDFDLSCTTYDLHACLPGGSLLYAAPEIILREDVDPMKSDIYSLGMTFYVMFESSSPFGYEDIREDIVNGNYFPLRTRNKRLKNLIKSMIHLDYRKRPDLKKVSQTLLRILKDM